MRVGGFRSDRFDLSRFHRLGLARRGDRLGERGRTVVERGAQRGQIEDGFERGFDQIGARRGLAGDLGEGTAAWNLVRAAGLNGVLHGPGVEDGHGRRGRGGSRSGRAPFHSCLNVVVIFAHPNGRGRVRVHDGCRVGLAVDQAGQLIERVVARNLRRVTGGIGGELGHDT